MMPVISLCVFGVFKKIADLSSHHLIIFQEYGWCQANFVINFLGPANQKSKCLIQNTS